MTVITRGARPPVHDSLGVPITADLAVWLAANQGLRLSAPVERESCRSFLNVLATAVGASRHPAVEHVIKLAADHGGVGVAGVPGRGERLDLHHAAIATGVAAHVDDFDDTHLETVIHPGASCLAAGLAMATWRAAPAYALLRAFTFGIEVQLRVGLVMTPWHYDEGWHITGTCGVIGAAVTSAMILGLDAAGITNAVGIAASQTLGHREAFGTMTKSFHPGKAAANGVLAALLAEQGFTASQRALEAPRGFFSVLSERHDAARLLDSLGVRWEILSNTYKPYPCGIVCHPSIDAALELAPAILDPEQIRSARLICHPLVVELTGRADPADGLEARFSSAHGVAVALVDKRVGLEQYGNARILDPAVARLRELLEVVPDPSLQRDEARLEVVLQDGVVRRSHVEHARGSSDRPLSDADLVDKARTLIEPTMPGRFDAIVDAVRGLPTAGNLSRLVEAIFP